MEVKRNVIYTYMPPKLYAFLVQLQADYGLSIQEVMTTVLRKGLQEFLEFNCSHDRIRTAKKTALPYCFDCWTRMQQVTAPTMDYKGKVIKEGTYRPLPTFLDVNEVPMETKSMKTFPLENKSSNTTVPSVQKQDII